MTTPSLIGTFARRDLLRDVRPLKTHAWVLASPSDVEDLHRLVLAPERQLSVVVLTEPDRRLLGGLTVQPFLLHHEILAKRLLGIAHVVAVPHALTYSWTDLIGGARWSTFQGAVRVYRPSFSTESDLPSDHPLTLATRVLASSHEALRAEEAFERLLEESLRRDASRRRILWDPIVFVPEARLKQLKYERDASTGDEARKETDRKEIVELRRQIDDLQRDVRLYSDYAEDAERERDAATAENRALRARTDALLARLADKTGQDPDAEVAPLDSYAELPEWVQRHFVGRLVLHERALAGLKKAEYEDVTLVGDALRLLATSYRDMKKGIDSARQAWEQGLKRLHLRCDSSISRERAGEQGDTYFVQHPAASTRRRFLELHLRKGVRKEDRYCLAIYFFWDDETDQVVVGWLPSHLDNRMS